MKDTIKIMKHMKIKRVLLLASMLICLDAFAQQSLSFDDLPTEKKLETRIGFVGGLNLSTISTSESLAADFGLRPGFNVGVAANFRFCKRNSRSTAKTGLLALQPEVRYQTMGGNSDASNLGMGYLTIPVMFQVYPAKNLFIEVGPAFTFNINHSPDHIVAGDYEITLNTMKANDVLLGVGVGYAVAGFSVGVRYNHGTSEFASNLPWKNSVVNINLGYTFSLSKKSKRPIVVNL